jgi:hypothetical protein
MIWRLLPGRLATPSRSPTLRFRRSAPFEQIKIGAQYISSSDANFLFIVARYFPLPLSAMIVAPPDMES